MATRRDDLTRRLNRLGELQKLRLVESATAAAQEIWSSQRPAEIRVREGFIALAQPLPGVMSDKHPPARTSGPPLVKLVSSHGLALRTALLALFVAQCSPSSPRAMGNLSIEPNGDAVGWRDLIVSVAEAEPGSVRAVSPTDNRVRQIKSAFDRLATSEIGLISQPRAGTARRKYDDMRLLHERGTRPTGAAPDYSLPRPAEPVVTLPSDFFCQGWVNVLDDSEIAAFLMFRHTTQSAAAPNDGVLLTGDDRLSRYVQRRSVWDKHQVLSDLGLMVSIADERRREDGTVENFATEGPGAFHRFKMIDEPLGRPALNSALADLAATADVLDSLGAFGPPRRRARR